MNALLSAAGKAFLKAFGASLLVLSQGVWAAPDLHGAELIAVAAFLGSLAAGLAALQVFVPQLTFAAYIGAPWGSWVDSFVRAFLGSLLTMLPGALTAPNLDTGKSLAMAAIVGAFNAALHIVQGFLTPGQEPAPFLGLKSSMFDKAQKRK